MSRVEGGEPTGSPPHTLAQAATLVFAIWERAEMSARALSQYQSTLRKFVRFAAAHAVTALADVDTELARAFITAQGGNRNGTAAYAVTRQTKKNRRDALRSFFTTATEAGWADANPTTNIAVPLEEAEQTPHRPLTDDEAEQVRFLTGKNPAHHTSAAIALQLAGAWAGEIGLLPGEAFDPHTRGLSLPGDKERRARTIRLDPDTARRVAARLDWLRARHTNPALLLTATASHQATTARVRIATQTARALRRAGLADEPTITPASLTLWAAKHEFETTGQIEDAARLIGYASLDRTAHEIGWDWSTGSLPAGGAA